MISPMRTARPTTGPSLSVFEVGTAPCDPAGSRVCFFGRLDPADPLIARERRNVLPRLQRFRVGGQSLFQVRGQVMDRAACDVFFAQSFAHRCIAGVESSDVGVIIGRQEPLVSPDSVLPWRFQADFPSWHPHQPRK